MFDGEVSFGLDIRMFCFGFGFGFVCFFTMAYIFVTPDPYQSIITTPDK